MRHDILLPALGDAESGEVSTWYRDTGARVTAGEPLVAVDVDKVVIDVPALVAGTLTIVASEGTEVRVGDLLCWVADDDSSGSPAPGPTQPGDAAGMPS
jgi:2-oxoglutarate dehydrogenase E2 component (dihydrolipoamide succinyltransferase)